MQCSKEEFIRGCSSGTDINLKEVDNGIVAVAEKYCYINVRELCYDIIRAAKKYIKQSDDIKSRLPKIKINKIGGRFPSNMNPDTINENNRLYKKYIKARTE